MKSSYQVVILCGGLGTRLLPYTNDIPKPMIDCNGKPFLWYLLNQFASQGHKEFLLLTGYKSEKITAYFGDGKKWGWNINYSNGPVEWDTGTRLMNAVSNIHDKFFLLYSDNFVQFSASDAINSHRTAGVALTLTVAQKTPGNIEVKRGGVVSSYSINRTNSHKYVEIGYMVANKSALFQLFRNKAGNFSEVIECAAKSDNLVARVSQVPYFSISDPTRWVVACNYLAFKKIIFLDRDGVINTKAPPSKYITNWQDFKWIKSTLDGMKLLSTLGYKFIVITNQAGIARGLVSSRDVEDINKKMCEKLSEQGIDILRVYFCPHHWDDDCSCRKPKPGMLLKAAQEFMLRLDQVIFVGDQASDLEAAKFAGCKGVMFDESGNWVHQVLTFYEGIEAALLS